MSPRFTRRRRGFSAQAVYEPRDYAEWREEERLIAAQEAERRQQQAAIPGTPAGTHSPPGATPCAD